MKNRMAIVLLFLIAVNTQAQKQYNVLDWKTDVTLNTWLVQQMHQQYDKRRLAFQMALRSKTDVQNYISQVRSNFRQVLGKLPPRTPLHANITGTLQRDGYRIEKLIFESFPGHHVTANLYVPQGKGPFPAALLFCGHEDVSKATESYQQTAILFAKNGFVVLVVDPISQSERYQLTDEKGNPLARGGTTEHTLLNVSSNLVGTSTPAYELWDNVRSMDYLVTRPEVDTTRIGCLGNSGGAIQAIYFAAFDERVKIIAPCSYLANRERTLELTGPADGCAQIQGEGKAQLEMSDYLVAAAPKPVLVLAGRYDFIDYTGTLSAYDDLKKVYQTLGQLQKLQLFTHDDGHGISKPKREAAVSWFRRWFYNDTKPVKEEQLATLTDKELFATTTGQVNTAFPEEVTIADRNRALFDSLVSSRQQFLRQSQAVVTHKIKELLAINGYSSGITIENKGQVEKGALFYQKIIIRKTNEIPIPALVASPSAKTKKVILWLHESGKRKLADSIRFMQDYLQNGYTVIMADIRGLGETEDKPELNDPKFYNKEYRNAMLALHIGQPVTGGRTMDILTILEYIKQDEQLTDLPVEIHATGFAAIPALYATFLDGKVQKVNLYQTIRSYREILEQPTVKNGYSIVVPGILLYMDLPDLVRLVGEQKVNYIK